MMLYPSSFEGGFSLYGLPSSGEGGGDVPCGLPSDEEGRKKRRKRRRKSRRKGSDLVMGLDARYSVFSITALYISECKYNKLWTKVPAAGGSASTQSWL